MKKFKNNSSNNIQNIDRIQDLLNVVQKNKVDNKDGYSVLCNAPIYKPRSSIKPNILALYDSSKTEELRLLVCRANNITESEREFLLLAVERFTVFNFSLIAEYYSHSEKHMQQLMEKLALVVIDINNAIAEGFVQVCKKIANSIEVSNE